MNFFNAEQARELTNLYEENNFLLFITEEIKKKAILGKNKLIINDNDLNYYQVFEYTHELTELGYDIEYDFDNVVIEW